jgi:hypothetical protein
MLCVFELLRPLRAAPGKSSAHASHAAMAEFPAVSGALLVTICCHCSSFIRPLLPVSSDFSSPTFLGLDRLKIDCQQCKSGSHQRASGALTVH